MISGNITTIIYVFVLLFTIGSGIYSLYMQRKNNETYNKKILSTLEEIRELLKK